AARALANASTAAKDAALRASAHSLRANESALLAENALDLAETRRDGANAAFLDRLTLSPKRIEEMAAGIEEIAGLADPVGRIIAEWDRPTGLHIERVRTPLGVVGIIYESRPNVTADAGALCLKAGNAAILRGGSDSHRSSRAIHRCLVEGLVEAGPPPPPIPKGPTPGRPPPRPRPPRRARAHHQ